MARLDGIAVFGGRISSLVASHLVGDVRGRVHSVFSSSMNVLLGDRLVHVGGLSQGLSCVGLSLDDAALRAAISRSSCGDAVLLREGVLQWGADDAALRIDVGSLACVDLSVRGVRLGRAALCSLGRMVRARGVEERMGLAGDFVAARALRTLADPRCDEGGMREAVSALVGRGPGLTPTGDDVLVGYGLGLWLLGEQDCFVRALGCVSRRTTDVGHAYLDALADGYVSEGLVRLVKTVGRASRGDEMAKALRCVESVGHTSGVDLLQGLSLACERAWRMSGVVGHAAVAGW